MQEKLCISTKPQKGCKEIISSAIQLRCVSAKNSNLKISSINGCDFCLITMLMFDLKFTLQKTYQVSC